MTTLVACPSLPARSSSFGTMTVYAFLVAVTFSASGAAPVPLYHHYQEAFGLGPAMLTVVFASYVLCLLAALLTAGSLSDHLGRRPVIAAALALNALAMVMFVTVHSTGALIAARAVQGFATGIATTTLGATILDADRTRGPLLNSITAFIGLGTGSLGAGLLVAFAPAPTQLVYLVLLAVSVVAAAVLWAMPETSTPRPGALASLWPHVHVPEAARRALMLVIPANVAFWALGGFYFSLMPSLVRLATGLTSPLVGGAVVAAFTLSGAVAVLSLQKATAPRLLSGGIYALMLGMALTLSGVRFEQVALMVAGTVASGAGFGAVLSGSMRSVMPLAKTHERAGLLAAFYVVSYLAFALPAMALGVAAPMIGLAHAAYFYGAAVVLLAATSLVASRLFSGR